MVLPKVRAALVLPFLFMFCIGLSSAALAQPVPPCSGSVSPPYAELGQKPNVGAWYSNDLRHWKVPACTGWQQSSVDAVAASAARFHHAGTSDEILARFAKVSDYTKILYESQHGNGWRPLVRRASALSGPSENEMRADFSPSELQSGRPVYLFMGGSAVNSVIYKMTVVEQTDDRLAIAIDNASTLRVAGIPMLREGAGQFLFNFEREGADVWRGYVMLRVGSLVNAVAKPPLGEYETRAVAMFRHFAGEPPPAPPAR